MCGFTVVAELENTSEGVHLRSGDGSVKGHAQTNGVVNGYTNGVNGKIPTSGDDESHHPISKAKIAESLAYIESRGPDSQGVWIDPTQSFGFGHCRLSINDLTVAGSQPLHNWEEGLHAVVNGELYDYDRLRRLCDEKINYPWQGHCDSELVLALYQAFGAPDFMQYLRGEFAFVIYDERKHQLITAVDRFGIKPLFWTVVDGNAGGKQLLLSSEAKGFLPLGWKPEWSVENIVTSAMIRGIDTLFKGVYKVQPGHMLTFSTDNLEERQYYDISYNDKNVVETRSIDEIVLQVREKLIDAVRMRLRSDVPVGIYLSGGLDSSTLAGILAEILDEGEGATSENGGSKNLTSFCVAFDKDSGFDESDIAQRTADFLGIPMKRCEMDEERLAANFEDATWHNEHHCPDLNTVGKFCLSQTAREHGYKVIITGEGSDEIFSGYPWFLLDFLAEPDGSMPELPLSQKPSLREQLHTNAQDDFISTFSKMGRGGDPGPNLDPDLNQRVGHAYTAILSSVLGSVDDVYTPKIAKRLGGFGRKFKAIVDALPPDAAEAMRSGKWHTLHIGQYIWIKSQLTDWLLTCLGDRAELSHSIEGRVPFLDHPLVDFVNSLPPSLKIHYGPNAAGPQYDGPWWKTNEDSAMAKFWEKWLLREAGKPYITEELYNRRKHLYSAPAKWPIGGPLHTKVSSLVTEENVAQLGFIDWETAKRELEQAFGDEATTQAFRASLDIAGWVVLSQRFGIARAESE